MLSLCVGCTIQNSHMKFPNIDNVGHGVYFFHYTGQEFAVQVAKFGTMHKITRIVPDVNRVGYIVMCDQEVKE